MPDQTAPAVHVTPIWPYSTAWTAEDSAAAIAEGWDVFMCGDSEHEPWELQRIDFPEDGSEPFIDDFDTWRHIVDKAAVGSTLHNRALLYLAAHSPGEFLHIGRWLAGLPSLGLNPYTDDEPERAV